MADDRETGLALNPKYDAHGLITAVCTDAVSGQVLMVAHMNEEALRLSLSTRQATFWSRSRQRIWRKGEESGNVLTIKEARIDCDQDCVWLICEPAGPACHTGETSCFFRKIESEALVRS